MFIKIKKRQNKKNETIYYFYKTENNRVDGKVKTKQEYLLNLKEEQINDSTSLEKLLKDISDSEIHLKVLEKIEDIKATNKQESLNNKFKLEQLMLEQRELEKQLELKKLEIKEFLKQN